MSAEGKGEFARQLRELGLTPEDLGEHKLAVAWTIPEGRFAGQAVRLGFDVPCEFARTPPSGPHMSPRILPINPNAAAHPARVHESPFGADWLYLSRPYPGWKPKVGVPGYLAFVAHLLRTS
jgi:hypothetical protein